MMHETIMPPRSTMKTPPMLASPICALVAAAPYGENTLKFANESTTLESEGTFRTDIIMKKMAMSCVEII